MPLSLSLCGWLLNGGDEVDEKEPDEVVDAPRPEADPASDTLVTDLPVVVSIKLAVVGEVVMTEFEEGEEGAEVVVRVVVIEAEDEEVLLSELDDELDDADEEEEDEDEEDCDDDFCSRLLSFELLLMLPIPEDSSMLLLFLFDLLYALNEPLENEGELPVELLPLLLLLLLPDP